MEFKKVLISELKPAAYNPRKNLSEKDPEYQRIRKSIETFGYVDPLIVNADHTVIGGHQRLKVLKDLGHAQIDVVLLDIPKTQEKALNVALNKITGEWDFQQLSIVLSELKEEDFDIEITGFSDKELKEIDEELFGKQVQQLDSEPQISRAEELRKLWGTELGQMWQCGEHRVICGDCTELTNVKRLMQGEKADLVFSSPPYNVDIKYNEYPDEKEKAEYKDLISKSTKVISEILEKGRYLCWNVGVSRKTFHIEQVIWILEHGFTFDREIVWEKQGVPWPLFNQIKKNPVARNYHPNYRHEIIFLFTTGKPEYGGPIEIDEKYSSDIWQVQQSLASVDLDKEGEKAKGMQTGTKTHKIAAHPAAYPVALPAGAISFLSSACEIVYDPFHGSGTTMIACENLGRRCRACEIDPGYVAVELQRYKDTFPGKEIRLIADNSGA